MHDFRQFTIGNIRCRHVNFWNKDFENFTTMGRFFKKHAKIAHKISDLATSGHHNSAMITNAKN